MLERVASYIWGTGLLVLLLGTGLCLSFRLRFFQFWGWKTILRRTFGSLRTKSGKGGTSLTQFQTFSTALAAAMGTGNILGVAAALCLGGAGAIFWMWVSALLGMALTYSENVLALRYARTLPDGTKAGGPMAYLRFGLHSPVLAVFYSLCCIGASLGMGNMTQSSAISTLAAEAFSLPPLWTGIGVTLLLGIILLRGTRSTGKVIQWLMPVLSAVYLLAALGVIFRNAAALPAAFGQIFREAFGLHAVGGGISGAVLQRAVQTGLRHGVFSNEAGLGSSALVHAGGSSEDAQLQGMWSMVEVALDTLVCCTLTALAVLTSGAMTQADNAGGIISAAFSGVFGQAAPELMAGITALFAFCTLIGWCCCGEQAVRYLGGEAWRLPYRVLFCLAAGVGAVVSLRSVWALSDIANGLMAVPNLLGLLLLLWPTGSRRETVKTETAASGFSLAETEEKLEALLCQIDGAGAVDVMLTLADGGEAVYQVDETVRDGGREEQTVLADKAPVLVQTRQPRFQGAVVVCEGADCAAVKLAVTEAVASLTGLGSGKIAVVKMKSSK